MDILSYDILFSLLTLTFLEIVLGIDNLIFIALAVSKLPASKRKTARTYGLGLALIIRILMLTALSWVMTLTKPIFHAGQEGFSVKDLLLIFGGIFLLVKSAWEVACDVFFVVHETNEEKKIHVAKNTFAAIIQISLIDFIFSFDSIITAVGMTNNIPVIISAIIIAMLTMLFASEKLSYFLNTYPSLKIVALAFIFMIGFILLSDGLHFHISKGYLYFSLFFTIVVESLNIVARKKHKS
jgi:predicted tellurium resistance membrane protein TerC